jgi:hypothetical protein
MVLMKYLLFFTDHKPARIRPMRAPRDDDPMVEAIAVNGTL